ncbi:MULTISPECIES: GerMN domain-containing protein [Arthrobacter]
MAMDKRPTTARRLRGALAAAALGLPLLLSACSASQSSTVSSALPEPSVLASSVPEATATLPGGSADQATQSQAQIYWIGRTGGNAYLFPEPRKTDKNSDPVTAALTVMMGQKPTDPDYFTAWQPPHRVAASISGTSTITVDVSSDAFSRNLDPSMAKRAIQQLVFTAASAALTSGMVDGGAEPDVVLLIDGRSDVKAFGSIALGQSFHRETAYLSPVSITSPQEGTTAGAGPLTFSGMVLGSSLDVRWKVVRLDVQNGQPDVVSAMTTAHLESAGVGRFSATVKLTPGRYELSVSKDGAPGTPAVVDTKTITIR